MTIQQKIQHYSEVLKNLRSSTHPDKEKYISKTTIIIAILQWQLNTIPYKN